MMQLDKIAPREASHNGRGRPMRVLFIAAVAILPVLLAGCATQIENGLQPVKVTETSGCSLCAAAYQGDLTQVTYLLQHGANPNATFNGRAPIGWALFSKKGAQWDIVLMLLHYHANPGMVVSRYKLTPLMAAAQTNTRALQALIDTGTDVNAQTSFGETALILALRWSSGSGQGTFRRVAELLKAKADPNVRNAKGVSALDIAVDKLWRTRGSKESIPIIRMLLAAGAKPEGALEQLALVMRNGLVANGAVPPGTKRALRLLLAYGAKPQNVRHPLLLSVVGDRPDLARMLINAGDPVDLMGDMYGRTALGLAVKANDIAQVKMLLDFGSGAYSDYMDPLAEAYTGNNNNLPMVRLLVQRAAGVQSLFAFGWPPKKGDLPQDPQLASFYLESEHPVAKINELLAKYAGKRALSMPDLLSILGSYEEEPIPALRRMIFVPLMGKEDLLPAPPEVAEKHAAAGNALWVQARSRTDAILAADQYEKAANLAPWVPAYQRNLCLLEYAAGEYVRAADDCGVYKAAFNEDLTVSRISAKLKSMKNIWKEGGV